MPPIPVHGMGSCLSDLDCILHPSGVPVSVSSWKLHTLLPVYGVVLLCYVVYNGWGVQFQLWVFLPWSNVRLLLQCFNISLVLLFLYTLSSLSLHCIDFLAVLAWDLVYNTWVLLLRCAFVLLMYQHPLECQMQFHRHCYSMGVKEAVKISKTGVHVMNRDWGATNLHYCTQSCWWKRLRMLIVAVQWN